MSLYIKLFNCNDLQSAILTAQQLSTVNGKSNNLVVPADILCKLNPEEVGCNTCVGKPVQADRV